MKKMLFALLTVAAITAGNANGFLGQLLAPFSEQMYDGIVNNAGSVINRIYTSGQPFVTQAVNKFNQLLPVQKGAVCWFGVILLGAVALRFSSGILVSKEKK